MHDPQLDRTPLAKEELVNDIFTEEELLSENDKWKSKYLRMAADFDNLRKRAVRNQAEAGDQAVLQFVKTLLPAKDAMERGLEMVHTTEVYDPAAFKEGMETTLDLLNGAFGSADIETIDPEGQPFDPALHDAVSTRQVPIAEPGVVLEVLEKGYRINDHLIRPAKVIVAAE